MLDFTFTEYDDYVVVTFKSAHVLTPQNLKFLTPPDALKNNFAHKGVVLSGRGPIWLYGYLIHYYHPTKFVASFDPRLNGAVIVESHSTKYSVGEVIPMNLEQCKNSA